MYVQHAEPILATITLEVLKYNQQKVGANKSGNLPALRIVFDLVQYREHLIWLASSSAVYKIRSTYILVARVCEHDDRETLQHLHKAAPFNNSNRTSIFHRVSLGEVVDYENHKVSNRYQRDDAGVLQRIQSPKKREWDDDKPVHACKYGPNTTAEGRISYMKTVIQKCRSTRNGTASAPSWNPLITPGIRSPMMIR
jgi:hypothetical protein